MASLPRLLIVLLLALGAGGPVSAETWRGLVVAPEHRCSTYHRDDYHYPQWVEPQIIKRLGGRIYGPYTGRYFANRRETHIEHIVALAEAHDSGMCAADIERKRRFARDLLNLTLAAPGINAAKSSRDAAEWLPPLNRCWFAARVFEVRNKYALTIDRAEADALDVVLTGCSSTELVFHPPENTDEPAAASAASGTLDPLALWDDNGNGRITCKEAERHAIAPVRKDHPAYPYMRDGDGDGVVCE